MNKMTALTLLLLLAAFRDVDGAEPLTGTAVECWELVGTSWEGKVRQGTKERKVLISFHGSNRGRYKPLSVLIELPDATKDEHKQLEAFFEIHHGFNKRWQTPDKLEPGQYLLAIHRGGLPAIPVPYVVIHSTDTFELQQVWNASEYWTASCKIRLERSDNKLRITLREWRGHVPSSLPSKKREMAKAVQRDITLDLERRPEKPDER